MNMTGKTLLRITKTYIPRFYLHFENNPSKNEIWLFSKLSGIKLFTLMVFTILLFSLMMYVNLKMYCRKTKLRNSKKYRKKHRGNNNLLGQLFLLTIFKCIIIGLVFFALKGKLKGVQTPHNPVSKEYFLSIQHYKDSYHSMDLQTKTIHEWYALSKLKFKSYKSFFRILTLLSGDIAMNPGPTSYPCAKCNKGVRVGVFCKTCNLWIHKKCEGLSNSELKALSKTDNLNFVCCVCREKQSTVNLSPQLITNTATLPNATASVEGEQNHELVDENHTQYINVSTIEGAPISLHPELTASSQAENDPFPFNETSLPENEQSFQFEAEHIQNISLEDETKIFKKKGLHFVHLNFNSLLRKIEEIREFALQSKPHVICFF